jgi:hypothetical protein
MAGVVRHQEGRIRVLYVHPDLQKRSEDLRRKETVQQAQEWRMLREGKRSRTAWLAMQGRSLLTRLGGVLIQYGRRLERYGESRLGLKVR